MLFGLEAQRSLKNSSVLVLGAGGIGSSLLLYLAASGIGKISIFEKDHIDRSNLGRQPLFLEEEIGESKGKIAVQRLNKLNPHIQLEWIPDYFNAENSIPYIEKCDILIEGTDSIKNKFLVNDLALQNNKPALIGGLGTIQGHILPISKDLNLACYRCLFEKPPLEGDIPTCAQAGILSPLPGIIGSMMAYLAVMYLIQKKNQPKIFILENMNWRSLHIQKKMDCQYCSSK